MVEVGEAAPDFELKDQNGNLIKLKDFQGKKLLIAFFPFAFSPVCTDELKCYETDMNQFKEKGAEIVGISVDSDWTMKAFAEKMGYNFPLLSDFGKEIAKKYGILRAEGFSERAYFVIDDNGKIIYKHVMDDPGTKLDNNELLNALQ